MAANILNSEKAIKVSVFIVRAFVNLRQVLSSNRELANKLAELERRLSSHDIAIRSLVTDIRDLTRPILSNKRRKIGF